MLNPNKVNQFILLIIAVLMSFPALANIDYYGGFSAGADIFTPERRVSQETAGLSVSVNHNQDSNTGAAAGIFLGARYQPTKWGIAAELSDYFSTAQTEAKTDNYLNNNGVTARAKIKHINTAALSLLPSYQLTDQTQIFLRGGYAYGRFSVKAAGDTGGDLIAAGQQTVWRNGYVVGAGVDASMTENISIRLEYDYSKFQAINQASVLPPVFLGDTIRSKVTPKDNMIMLSVVFHHLWC